MFVSKQPLESQLSTPPVLACMALLAAALAWDALTTVFPAAGERHWKLLSAQARQQFSCDMHQTMRLNRAGGARSWRYALLLRGDLRPAAKPDHLLLHALGPYNHRYDFLLPLLITLALAGAAWMGMPWAAVQFTTVHGLIFSFGAPLILLQGLTFERLVVSMDNTRGEQALVRLAPRAPQADRLVRSLARQLLQICLTEWLVCALTVLALAWLFGAANKELMALMALICASFAMTGWALRDYSRKRAGLRLKVIVQMLLVAAGAIAMLQLRANPVAWSALLVLMLAAGCAIVHDRWQAMLRGPLQYPARPG
ncbi:MAG: hypothetical protein V4484_14955 [Pseudomonadota bacterium]